MGKEAAPGKVSDAPTTEGKGSQNSSALLSVRNVVMILALAGVGYMAFGVTSNEKQMQEYLESTIDWIQAQGDNGLYAYLLMTFIGVVCLVPTTPMELAGGFLFSPRYGMWTTLFLTSGAKLCANTVSVFIARHIVKDWVK